jgi:hypothetical protein
MSATTSLYDQVLPLLRQYSHRRDLRHLKALAWMVTTLVCSGQLSLPEWEAYVPSRARQALSTERRWQRFMGNRRVRFKSLYVPLVLAAIHQWQGRRLYLGLDMTVLWNRYCMIHLSVTCCGQAVPLLWRVLEHSSATVSTERYLPPLRLAHRLLPSHADVMLLPAFARLPLSNDFISSLLSLSSMAPPRVWPLNSMASALRLTPIGHGASVTSKLASAGSRDPLTKGVRCSNPSPYSPLTLNLALPLKKPKPNIMTASGSPGFSLCAANYHPGRLAK